MAVNKKGRNGLILLGPKVLRGLGWAYLWSNTHCFGRALPLDSVREVPGPFSELSDISGHWQGFLGASCGEGPKSQHPVIGHRGHVSLRALPFLSGFIDPRA